MILDISNAIADALRRALLTQDALIKNHNVARLAKSGVSFYVTHDEGGLPLYVLEVPLNGVFGVIIL